MRNRLLVPAFLGVAISACTAVAPRGAPLPSPAMVAARDLAPEQLYEGRDLALTTDFRSVFAEVATRHMGAGRLDAVLPGYDATEAAWLGAVRS